MSNHHQAKDHTQLNVKCECANEVLNLQKKNSGKIVENSCWLTMGKSKLAASIALAVVVVFLVCNVESKVEIRFEAAPPDVERFLNVDKTRTSQAETNIEESVETEKTSAQDIGKDKVERKTITRDSLLRPSDFRSGNKTDTKFDKSIFERLHNQSKIKSDDEIVDQSSADHLSTDENVVDHRQGRSNFKSRNVEPSSGRTSEDILNEIANFGLDQSRYLFDVQEKRIYDNGLTLKKSDPGHFVGVFNKQTQRAKELSKYGYATLQASSLLSKQ